VDRNEVFALATAHFLSLLDEVGPEKLALDTPCEEWDVEALLWHVTRASEAGVAMVNGASEAEVAGLFSMEGSGDVVAQCRRTLDEAVPAFAGVTDFERIVHHPRGDMPLDILYGFRIGDLTLHAWDLARALGGDEVLPEAAVLHVYEALKPMEPIIGTIGAFGSGPSGDVGEDATLQLRLLDLSGRRP
jgi:uncharacterized protein (TIGR03086 family)